MDLEQVTCDRSTQTDEPEPTNDVQGILQEENHVLRDKVKNLLSKIRNDAERHQKEIALKNDELKELKVGMETLKVEYASCRKEKANVVAKFFHLKKMEFETLYK